MSDNGARSAAIAGVDRAGSTNCRPSDTSTRSRCGAPPPLASNDELALCAHISAGLCRGDRARDRGVYVWRRLCRDQLVATCGWTPVDDTVVARIRWCHVQPMFGGLGIGSALLAHTRRRRRMPDTPHW
jgi:hypothetical protein